jgi:hypothetical protein
MSLEIISKFFSEYLDVLLDLRFSLKSTIFMFSLYIYFSSSCFSMNNICMFKWMMRTWNGGKSLWAGCTNTHVFITELFHLIRCLFTHEMLKCDSSTLTHSNPVNFLCFTAECSVLNTSVTYILNLHLVKTFIGWIGRFRTACYISGLFHSPWRDYTSNIWWAGKWWNYTLCNSLQSPVSWSLLGQNILLSTLFLTTPQSISSS